MSIHMFIPGVKGESTDPGHEDWIDVESLSWGVNRNLNSNSATKGDRESGNATISDLHVVRNMDSATPKLFIDGCCGEGKEIIIEITKTGKGGGSETYMRYTLGDSLIGNYTVNANAQDGSHPTETLSIAFIDMEMTYTPYDDGGKQQASETVAFDTATNTKR